VTGQSSTEQIGTLESAGSLIISGSAPLLGANLAAAPQTGALVLTGFAPLLGGSYAVTPLVGSLVLTGQNSTTQGNTLETAGALVLAGYAPTAQTTAAGSVIPLTGVLNLTGQNSTTQGKTLESTGTLSLTGYQVQVGLAATPLVGGLVLGPIAPSLGQGVLETQGSLALTGQQSGVRTSLSIAPSTGGLVITGQLCGIVGPLYATGTTGTLVISGFKPTTMIFDPRIKGRLLTLGRRDAEIVIPERKNRLVLANR
jgi:hypothetical protein